MITLWIVIATIGGVVALTGLVPFALSSFYFKKTGKDLISEKRFVQVVRVGVLLMIVALFGLVYELSVLSEQMKAINR